MRGTALLLGLLGVGLVGCSSAADRLTERAVETVLERASDEDVDLDLRDGSMTIESDEGTFSIGTGVVPDLLTDAFSLPSGFQVASSAEQVDGTTVGVNVNGMVEGRTPDQVVADIDAELDAGGWEVLSTMNLEGQMIQRVAQRGEESLSVGVITDGDEVMVTLTLVVDRG